MAKVSKRLKALRSYVEANKLYAIDEAIALVKKAATAKFDESVDVSSVSYTHLTLPTILLV